MTFNDAANTDSDTLNVAPEHSESTAVAVEDQSGAALPRWSLDSSVPAGFRVDEEGVWKQVGGSDEEDWFWLCSPLSVVARARDFDSRGWALRVEVTDPDGLVHQSTILMARVAEDGASVRRELSDLGLRTLSTTAARKAFTEFLLQSRPNRRITVARSVGWNRQTFVLPDAAFGNGADEVEYHEPNTQHSFMCRGTLDEWKDRVAAACRGQSRLLLALCVTMAAPLLRLAGGESGGVHLVGPSSTGKTTALLVAGSFWGGGEQGNLLTWRATDSAIEKIAEAHCDTGIVLDELGQADADAVKAITYMLGNGRGKARANTGRGAPAPASWRLTFVSTGEVSLATKLEEGGGRAMAGQQVRLVDVGLPETGLGIFDFVPADVASAAALATKLKAAATSCYGVASREYLRQLTESRENVAAALPGYLQSFVDAYCPAGSDGQVSRVAARFALFAAAGELATEMGILPYEIGHCVDAVAQCFRSWLARRGGTGSAEMLSAVRDVLASLRQHGQVEFRVLNRDHSEGGLTGINGVIGWGYRESVDEQDTYWATPLGFRRLCGDHEPKAVARELIKLGILHPAPDGKSSKSCKFGRTQARYYHVTPPATWKRDVAGLECFGVSSGRPDAAMPSRATKRLHVAPVGYQPPWNGPLGAGVRLTVRLGPTG